MACHLLYRRKHQVSTYCGIRVASQHTPPRRFSGRGLAILKMRKLPVQYVETLALPLGPMASLSANEFFFRRTTRGHSEALATFFPQTGDFSRRRIAGAGSHCRSRDLLGNF